MLVRGDRVRLGQLVANLLSNAVMHTPAGVTVAAAVATESASTAEPVVALRISDDGPGIPEAILPSLFAGSSGPTRPVRAKWVPVGWGWRSSPRSSTRTAGRSWPTPARAHRVHGAAASPGEPCVAVRPRGWPPIFVNDMGNVNQSSRMAIVEASGSTEKNRIPGELSVRIAKRETVRDHVKGRRPPFHRPPFWPPDPRRGRLAASPPRGPRPTR